MVVSAAVRLGVSVIVAVRASSGIERNPIMRELFVVWPTSQAIRGARSRMPVVAAACPGVVTWTSHATGHGGDAILISGMPGGPLGGNRTLTHRRIASAIDASSSGTADGPSSSVQGRSMWNSTSTARDSGAPAADTVLLKLTRNVCGPGASLRSPGWVPYELVRVIVAGEKVVPDSVAP